MYSTLPKLEALPLQDLAADPLQDLAEALMLRLQIDGCRDVTLDSLSRITYQTMIARMSYVCQTVIRLHGLLSQHETVSSKQSFLLRITVIRYVVETLDNMQVIAMKQVAGPTPTPE